MKTCRRKKKLKKAKKKLCPYLFKGRCENKGKESQKRRKKKSARRLPRENGGDKPRGGKSEGQPGQLKKKP